MSVSVGYQVRVGIIKNVGRTYVDFEFLDRIDQQTFRAPLPQPYAGRGGGILAGIEKDTLVLVASGPSEKWYCIGIIPDHNFYFGMDGSTVDIKTHETPYPTLKEGEISLKSNQGAQIDLLNTGNIALDVGAGLSLDDLELSRLSRALFTRVDNVYSFTEASRLIEGVIKRDMNLAERATDSKTLNYLDSERYERLLSIIGRSNTDEVQNRTTNLIKSVLRNPALVEKRELIYEYANSFNVRHFEDEVGLSTSSIDDMLDLQPNPADRENRRTDILNLNQRNFNHLIEKVEGTLVDIYGNILDINRNVINIPDIEEIESSGNDTKGLKRVYDHHRRAVKFHYEINSRKDINTSEPADTDKTKNNAKNFSRWSVDVDGEGLTKINIPASSETGNIPVLSRYFTSRDEEDKSRGSFKDSDRKDVRIQQFGAKSGNSFSGASISNSDYVPTTIDNSPVTAGTAYHDLMNIAESIFQSGALAGRSGALPVSSEGPMSTSITNKIPDKDGTSDANAGGKSLHINLDGSMEMSVGADTIDKKSILLDTQGGVISHFGRDKNGRSLIHQTDGDVIIQIGGDGTDSTDDRFQDTENRPGRLEIHLNRTGGTPQKILIDENGMTLDVQGNMVLQSSGEMALKSGGRLLLHGELIFAYGAVDTETRVISGSETLIVRAGSPQFT